MAWKARWKVLQYFLCLILKSLWEDKLHHFISFLLWINYTYNNIKDRIFQKMHVVIFNIIYMQSKSVHKLLIDWLNIKIAYCIFFTYSDVSAYSEYFCILTKNSTNIYLTIHKRVEQKKTDYRYVYIISNILRLKEYSDDKNKLLNFHIGWLYELYNSGTWLYLFFLFLLIKYLNNISRYIITTTAIHLYKTIFVIKNYVIAKLVV